MLIGWIAYIYVIGMIAVAMMVGGKIVSGMLFFAFLAAFPAGLWFWLVSQRQKAKLARMEAARTESGADISE